MCKCEWENVIFRCMQTPVEVLPKEIVLRRAQQNP